MYKRKKVMKNKKSKQPKRQYNSDDDDQINQNEEQSNDVEMDDDELIDDIEDDTVHCTYNNPGWSDVISKILKKQPKLQTNQESCILMKATKDYEIIETDQQRRTDKERREWENLNRSKPTVNDRERERKLTAIATRGVVQLFNTISDQKEERRKK